MFTYLVTVSLHLTGRANVRTEPPVPTDSSRDLTTQTLGFRTISMISLFTVPSTSGKKVALQDRSDPMYPCSRVKCSRVPHTRYVELHSVV